jgi:hypothetical protein
MGDTIWTVKGDRDPCHYVTVRIRKFPRILTASGIRTATLEHVSPMRGPLPAHAKRTEENDAKFFTALTNAHSVRAACAAAGYKRQVVYRWRRKDTEFDARWRQATLMGGDILEEEADRRGRDGYDQPVYFRGKEVGTKRKYSDGLLHARLKAVLPERYREHGTMPADQPRPINVQLRDFALEFFIENLVKQGRVALEEVPQRLKAHLAEKTQENKPGATTSMADLPPSD